MSWLFVKAGIMRKPKVVVAAIILISICMTVAAYKILFEARGESEGIALLKKAYNSRRPIKSRVVDFEYAPFISTRGQEGGSTHADNIPVDHTELVLLNAVYYEPDAQSHHALGVFHLLDKQFDKAIREFEKALSYEPSSAKLHSDLGAALLEKAQAGMEKERLESEYTGKPVEEMSRSLEHIRKALDIDGSLKEASFNLGLLQEQLGLSFAAKDTLSKYLEADVDSGWAREAGEILSRQDERARAISLSKEELLADFLDAFEKRNEDRAWEIISKNRSPLNGKYISELLVDAYIAQSINLGKAGAANTLSALFFLAALEVRKADEHYSERLAQFYKTQTQGNLARLKQARDAVKRGHELYFLDKGDEALRAYIEAKKIFDSLNDGCESLSAEYRIAYCHSENRDTATSLPIFERLSPLCEKEKFNLLQVSNLLGAASDEFSQRRYSDAIGRAFHAFEIARRLGDEVSVFSCLAPPMEFYRAVGNHKKSLACLQNNLEYSTNPSINRLQKYLYYSVAASAISSAGYIDSSLEFRKEASIYLMQDVPRDAALYYADLSGAYSELKKFDEASANLDRSYKEAQAITPDPVKNLILLYATLHKGTYHKKRLEYQDALSSYSDALNLTESVKFPAFTYQARKGRLLCYIALGDDAMAETEIAETLKLLESHRAQIIEQENRNSFFDNEQDVYDLAIDYECSRRNNHFKAFDYSEESRARTLLDLLTKKEVSPPLTSQTIQERLPKQLQVIQYSMLANKVVIWVLESDSIAPSYAEVDITQEELSKKVKAYLNNISRYSEEESDNIATQSKDLFDKLIKPVFNLLNRDKTICIVPDKVLNNLPFETLISTETQKYLIEDFSVIYSPSSSVLLACVEEAKSKEASGEETLLGVGNPRFDLSLFKGLSDLPDAKTEVTDIASYYQDPIILTVEAASEERVKSGMQKATVIHFATHSILDEDSHLRSKILLTRERANTAKGSDGVLESHEIYKTRLPNARLVVLSSCQSGIDRYYKGEGMMSIARSFMAAGVPTVVASLWKVDSKAAAGLMVEFHRLKKQKNMSVVESLREAKLSMLSDRDSPFRHPYFWSAFIAIGGEARF
jgi:CHAT domain-containing protein